MERRRGDGKMQRDAKRRVALFISCASFQELPPKRDTASSFSIPKRGKKRGGKGRERVEVNLTFMMRLVDIEDTGEL